MYQQGNFYRIPKLLIQGKKYERLSSDAKLLYAVYQDRAELSIQNKWTDSNGDIFFLYSIDEVCFFMGWGKDKVIKVKKELIKYALLSERRQGRNLVNKTYLYLVDTSTEQRKFISKSKFLSEIDKWLNILDQQLLQCTNEEIQDYCLKYLTEEFSLCGKAVDNFLTSYKIIIPQIIEDKKKSLCMKEVGISDLQTNDVALRNSGITTSGTLKSRLLEVGKPDPNDTDSNDKSLKEDEKKKVKVNQDSFSDETYHEEIERLQNEVPSLKKLLRMFPTERLRSMKEKFSLVQALDECYQQILYEQNNQNPVILVEIRLYGERAIENMLQQLFEQQLEYTRNHCRNSTYFVEYFIHGLKERVESKLF